jgi:MraZ protein
MFLGEYVTKFSGIGRVILPKKLRGQLQGNAVILSRGFEECIWGFDLGQFEVEAKKQLEIPATEERGRFIRRYLFSGSEQVELDSQGRFVIPASLLDFAKVDEPIVIGAGDHFEIWERKNWERHISKIKEEYARIS